MKRFFKAPIYLGIVLIVTALTGCAGPLETPRDASARGMGRVVVSIGDTDSAQARTVAPDTGAFTKYTLTFSGPAPFGPVDIENSSGAAFDLAPGSWTITATAYTGTAGDYAAVAEGSAQVALSAGETVTAAFVLGPITTAAGTGIFRYAIAVPAGATGSLVIATAEGETVEGGTIALEPGTTNAGEKVLAPGEYLARVRLEQDGEYAGFTEALHVYAGLVSELSERAYTYGDFGAFIDRAAYPYDRDFIIDLKALLQEAAPEENTPDTPISLKVAGVDLSTKLGILTDALTRYVSLDLSECPVSITDTSIPGYPSSPGAPWGHLDLKESQWVVDLLLPAAVTSLSLQSPPVQTFDDAYINLRSFTAPGVAKIGDSIFRGLPRLERVELPALKTMYNVMQFADCPALKTVTIPSAEILGKWVFANCAALETIEIGQVTSVGSLAFEGANPAFNFVVSGPSPLTWNAATRQLIRTDGSEVTLLAWLQEDRSPAGIPAGITKIGDNLFYGLTNFTGVNLPATVTAIGDDAFAYCSSLTQASLPGVTEIGEYAFFKTALVEADFPEVTRVGWGAFSMCLELESVKLPKVEEIGYGAFDNGMFTSIPSSADAVPDIVGKLASVDLGDSLETIGELAFMYCTKLESLTLPATVKYIGDQAFASKCGIKTITVNAVTPPDTETFWKAGDPKSEANVKYYSPLFGGGISHITGEQYPYTLETIYVPAGSVDAYKTASGWSYYAAHIKAIE